MITAGWDSPLELTKMEVVQREYEGCVVPEAIKSDLASLTEDSKDLQDKLTVINAELEALTPSDDFGYDQPMELDAIRALRPDGPRILPMDLSDDELKDRLHGAWTGRAVGCALGKPVELLGMRGTGGQNGRSSIKSYLETRGEWPLTDYFPEANGDEAQAPMIACPKSLRENIRYMEPDDDIHYTLIGLKVLETYGPDFQWHHVADAWNTSLPYSAICTAETQAILNYNMTSPNTYIQMSKGRVFADPAFTARNNNPYREWIGAQIRADGWAYACAGNPELAAEFAWRDAHWTHTANGIYGEMMAAAMIAAAFVESDPRALIEIGLSEIPATCKLAEAVREALEWTESCPDWESFMDRLDQRYGGMSPVHTVNNALIVAMSLIYGEMDAEKSISISVMAGLDTDCNGATVGSITGAAAGKAKFGGAMQDRLNDTIKPLVFGFQEVTMAELADRHLAVWKRVNAA